MMILALPVEQLYGVPICCGRTGRLGLRTRQVRPPALLLFGGLHALDASFPPFERGLHPILVFAG